MSRRDFVGTHFHVRHVLSIVQGALLQLTDSNILSQKGSKEKERDMRKSNSNGRLTSSSRRSQETSLLETNSLASQRIVYNTAPCTLFGQVSNMNCLQAFQSTMKELRTTSRASNHVAGKPHGGCTEKPIPQQGPITMRMTHISTDQWFYVHLRRRETFRIQVR